LAPKEGIALINGTQFMASLGAEALERAKNLCKTADVIASLTLEVLRFDLNFFLSLFLIFFFFLFFIYFFI
jgi:histidine ammonia-lyase